MPPRRDCCWPVRLAAGVRSRLAGRADSGPEVGDTDLKIGKKGYSPNLLGMVMCTKNLYRPSDLAGRGRGVGVGGGGQVETAVPKVTAIPTSVGLVG
jgi:hypothetical protein